MSPAINFADFLEQQIKCDGAMRGDTCSRTDQSTGVRGSLVTRAVAGADELTDRAVAIPGDAHEAPSDLDRLVPILDLDDRVTDDELLGLGEWPVGIVKLAARALDPCRGFR